MKPRAFLPFLLFLALCAACAPVVQPGPAAPVPALRGQPRTGYGGVSGQVLGAPEGWQPPLQLYAAPFLNNGAGQGFYMLEPDVHPSSEVAGDGTFWVNDIPPGEYVLVAGPTPEEARLLLDDQQQTKIVTVGPDQVLDLGPLQISE